MPSQTIQQPPGPVLNISQGVPRTVMRVRPAANFSRATAVVVSTVIEINPVAKSLIVVIELVLLTLDGAATLACFRSQ
jgi:hypothetical protein